MAIASFFELVSEWRVYVPMLSHEIRFWLVKSLVTTQY